MPAHVNITDPNLHEPKGAAGADAGSSYVADGAGSGDWTFSPVGWGLYVDDSAGQTITTTPALLTCDAANAATETDYLPLAIRGSGNLWSTVLNAVTPVAAGDLLLVRIAFRVTSKSSSPTNIRIQADIGGTSSPTDVIAETRVNTNWSTTFTNHATLVLPVEADAVTNGIQLFVNTDAGSATVVNHSVLITRLHGEVV